MRPLRDNEDEFDIQLELADMGHIATVISLFITEFSYLFSVCILSVFSLSLSLS
jgi:hypothetical protein